MDCLVAGVILVASLGRHAYRLFRSTIPMIILLLSQTHIDGDLFKSGDNDKKSSNAKPSMQQCYNYCADKQFGCCKTDNYEESYYQNSNHQNLFQNFTRVHKNSLIIFLTSEIAIFSTFLLIATFTVNQNYMRRAT